MFLGVCLYLQVGECVPLYVYLSLGCVHALDKGFL
jgi:hypothetical protein